MGDTRELTGQRDERRKHFIRCLKTACSCAFLPGALAVIAAGLFLSDSPGWQVTICALAAVGGGVLGYRLESSQLRRQKANALDEANCRAWLCPNCGATYGQDSQFSPYGKQVGFELHCVMVCHSCNYLNCFDHSGRAQYGCGELFVPELVDGEPHHGNRSTNA